MSSTSFTCTFSKFSSVDGSFTRTQLSSSKVQMMGEFPESNIVKIIGRERKRENGRERGAERCRERKTEELIERDGDRVTEGGRK